MALTPILKLDAPDYKTLRYDQALNLDLQRIEDSLLGFPSVYAPGTPENYPDIVLSNGLKWLDIANDQLKMYYEGDWVVISDLPAGASVSPSVSPSVSISRSPSTSVSRSPSTSASVSVSISPSVSVSISPSISASISASSSPSA
jgi:hypothetical protein